MLLFGCQSCGHKLRCEEKYAGRIMKCPLCSHRIVVPSCGSTNTRTRASQSSNASAMGAVGTAEPDGVMSDDEIASFLNSLNTSVEQHRPEVTARTAKAELRGGVARGAARSSPSSSPGTSTETDLNTLSQPRSSGERCTHWWHAAISAGCDGRGPTGVRSGGYWSGPLFGAAVACVASWWIKHPVAILLWFVAFVVWSAQSALWIHQFVSGLNEHAARKIFVGPWLHVASSFVPVWNLLWGCYFIGKSAIVIERLDVKAGFKNRPAVFSRVLLALLFAVCLAVTMYSSVMEWQKELHRTMTQYSFTFASAEERTFVYCMFWGVLLIAFIAPPLSWWIVGYLQDKWENHMRRHNAGSEQPSRATRMPDPKS